MDGEIDGYRLLRELGRGGAGAVYLAQRSGEVPVALKLIQVGLLSKRHEARVRKEIEAHLALNHPGIVRLRGAGVYRGHPYLVMDYVDGESLAQLLRSGPLEIDRAVELVRDLAQAIQHVHERGLLHRDLKPANVLIDQDGRTYVADFGLTRELDPDANRLTRTGSFVGTPGYWPPEQALGLRTSTGPAADVYGLGGILYACLTARPPRPEQLSIDALKTPIVPPHRLRPDVPRWLSAACMACLRDDPAQRPATARDLLRALDGPRAGVTSLPLLPIVGGAVAALGILAALAVLASAPSGEPAGPKPERPVASVPDVPETAERPSLPPEPGNDAAEAEAEAEARANAEARTQEEAQALERANKLGELGDDVAALAAVQPLLDRGTTNAELWRLGGLAKSGLGRFAEAHLDLERALELDPALAAAWISLAHVRMKMDRAEPALDAIRRGVAVAPELPDAHYNHGRILQQLGRNEQAVLAYARCLERRPTDAGALTNRAIALRQLARDPEAHADLDRALQLDRNNPIGLEQRAALLINAGRFQEALEDLTLALQLEPNPPALNWSNHGVVLAKLERYEEARRSLQQALRLGHRHPTTYMNLGHVEAQLGDVPAARRAFEESLKLLPPGPQREKIESDLAALPE